MFMILLLHANIKTFGWPEENNTVTLLRIVAESINIIAVNVFVLISGYYGVSFRIYKIVDLCFRIVFTVFTITMLFYAFGLYKSGSIKELVHGFYFWNYWFCNAYIVLLVLSPLLNLAVERLNRAQFKYILIILFVIFSIVQGDLFITPPGVGVNGGCSTLWFLFLYMLGRYISINPPVFKIKKYIWMYLCGLFGTVVLMWKFHNFSYNNPFITLQSVSFFLLFLHLDCKSRLINTIASSSLMVYLLHGHPLIFQNYYCETIKCLYTKFDQGVGFIVSVFAFCIMVYFIAILFDQLRKFIWSLFESRIKKFDKIVLFN